MLQLGLDPLRLSAYWDDIEASGYDALDWQLAEAERAGRSVLLTVGMKAQGWPEFYLPARLVLPGMLAGRDVMLDAGELADAVLEFLRATVQRYRGSRALLAWQVENEPLNRSGPSRWWIGPEFLAREIAAVRELDPGRPVALNVFAHFNRRVDVRSSRYGFQLRRFLRGSGYVPEEEALTLLRPGDVLGLDVYRRIGYRLLGLDLVTRAARTWAASAARWRERAAAALVRAWIMEAQAEPWGPPRSCRPDHIAGTLGPLREAGFDTMLLWGVEHWLARDAAGDGAWLSAVERQMPGDVAP